MHVPAGAIPKDGPSAGVTMVTALASLLSGRPVKHTVGMTGEVTLQGRVLPIGGVKQKVLAAHAAGLTDVILPERNRGDLDDVPADVREQMTFHFAMTVDEVLAVALEPARAPRAGLTALRCRLTAGSSLRHSERRAGRQGAAGTTRARKRRDGPERGNRHDRHTPDCSPRSAAALCLIALASSAALAAYPNSMAATGDSITRAFNTCSFPFTDCPQNSWATGTEAAVNSFYLRIRERNRASKAGRTTTPGRARG